MSIRNPEQRVGVFVDVQNLYYSARHMYNSRVNFNEVLKEAVGPRRLIRAIAYVVQADMPEENTFFEALGKAGFEVKKKDLQTFAGGHQKGDWDVGIAMDIVKLMPKLDVVVLCSGDGDFAPLLEYLQMSGQLAETLSFGKSTSSKLKELTDHFVDLDNDPKKFLIPMRGGSGGGKRPSSKTPSVKKIPSIFDY
ncbi:MAG: NYN domain-containing protein [Candidatus Doudnabacteria bacterium]|nr:NYN domain-containing protein [Candidatus Doudnabacteria bacterium]